ncbi:hypothetical protein [Streptomyces sp. NPDC001815]|uniref:hypothetical protein n=1 Tax=Streptomyces sp. NPDC001815 TaxID=3154526 RepID=UPI003325C011
MADNSQHGRRAALPAAPAHRRAVAAPRALNHHRHARSADRLPEDIDRGAHQVEVPPRSGIHNLLQSLHTAARDIAPTGFLHDVPILVAAVTDLLRDGPSAPVWRPVHDPARRVSWMYSRDD